MASLEGEDSMCSSDLEAWRISEEEEREHEIPESFKYSKEETGYGSNYTDSEVSERSYEQYEDYGLEELETKLEVANCTIAYLCDENSSLEKKVASMEAEKEQLAEMNQKLRNELEESHELFRNENGVLVEQVSELLDTVFRLENENEELVDRVAGLSIVVPR